MVEFTDGIFFGYGAVLDIDADLFKLGHSYYLTFMCIGVAKWDVACIDGANHSESRIIHSHESDH